MIQKFSETLKSVNDFEEAREKIQSFSDKEFSKSFDNHLLNSLETINALGRSLIIKKDESLSDDENIVTKNFSNDWIVCDDVVKVSFDIVPTQIKELLHQRAIKIGDVENTDLKEFVQQKLEDAILRNLTFDEWKAEIDSVFDSFGITKLSRHHAELVFRMNIFAVYSQGMAQQVSEISDRFPLAYFSPIRDSRSRHISLGGYYPVDRVPLPPIDYGCRCTVLYVHVSQITGKESPFYEEPPRLDLIRFDQRQV